MVVGLYTVSPVGENVEALSFLEPVSTKGNLANKAYVIIKDAIVNGWITSGHWLMEDEVAKQLCISRTPVREAFRRLQGDGLLEFIPRKGARVPDLSDSELEELLDAREQIEIAFLGRSIENIDLNKLNKYASEFKDLEKKMIGAKDVYENISDLQSQYIMLDRNFHDFIIESSGNRYWLEIYHSLRNIIQFSSFKAGLISSQFEKAIEEHNALIDAIMAKDTLTAKKIMSAHIQNFKKRLLFAIKRNKRPLPTASSNKRSHG